MDGDSLLLAEATAFRMLDDKWRPLSHTAGLVAKQLVQLVRYHGTRRFELRLHPSAEAGGGVERFELHDDWDLLPDAVDKICRDVHTEQPPATTAGAAADDACNGIESEADGEDIPLYCFQIKRKSHLLQRLLHPNTQFQVPAYAPNMDKLRIGFEDEHEAQEWYALVALCLGLLQPGEEGMERLQSNMARSASQGILA